MHEFLEQPSYVSMILLYLQYIYLIVGSHQIVSIHPRMCFKLMEGSALKKHSLHGKSAASVLLKLLSMVIKDVTPLTHPSTWAELYFQM